MILVIEAGGTKTELRTIHHGEFLFISGPGINPYFQSDGEIEERLNFLLSQVVLDVHDLFIYYYGAGCGSEAQQSRVFQVLEKIVPLARISVFHDLMGSARALCGNEKGFVGILGTGSNACLFDGESIVSQMVSLGFWLGDEGSGGYLGKCLFVDWLKNRLPVDLETEFLKNAGFQKSNALQELYADPQANSRLAALARFCFSHRAHPYIEDLITKNISAYFREIDFLLEGQRQIPMHFSGSIAKLLESDLKRAVQRQGQVIGTILANPSESLFEYHYAQHI